MVPSKYEPGSQTRIQQVLGQLMLDYGQPVHRPRFDPMEELVSCILSQHSADANSFPAFTLLRERFPSWEDLARADHAAVAQTIKSAGLANQKAKSILECLRIIHAHCGSYSLDFLRSFDDGAAIAWLEKLPGVGPKTAAIVMCFAFGRAAIPVDTHVSRVSKRLGFIPETMTDAVAHRVLREQIPPDLAFAFHTLLIQHGRIVCQAKKPACTVCRVAAECPWNLELGGRT